MTLARVLRNGYMDLLSATAFLLIWLLRERFEYDTLRALVWWPVAFEMYVTVALLLAGMLGSIQSNAARNAWFAAVACSYLFASWLSAASAGMPHAWTIAAWLLVARLVPPPGMRFGEARHREWIQKGTGYTGMLWGAGFVLTVLLMVAVPGVTVRDAAGELHSTSPAWIFPLVWTPYFIAIALVRAWRISNLEVNPARAADTSGRRQQTAL